MEATARDARLAARGLLRRPGSTAVAVASLAFGIGGATAMFALVDGVLLRPLAFTQPERLTQVFLSIPSLGCGSGVRSRSPSSTRLLVRGAARGRELRPGDADAGETPILVGETLAARACSGEDAVGKRLLEEEDGQVEASYLVVGVVADVTLRGPGTEPELLAYWPHGATPWARDLYCVARTDGGPPGARARRARRHGPGRALRGRRRVPVPAVDLRIDQLHRRTTHTRDRRAHGARSQAGTRADGHPATSESRECCSWSPRSTGRSRSPW